MKNLRYVKTLNQHARQLKADALQSMAQMMRAAKLGSNFSLPHASHLEGKIDAAKPPKVSPFARPAVETILATPPGTFVKLLEVSVDPEKSAEVDAVVRLTFSDLNRSWAIHIRRGIAEVTEKVPEKVDASIELPRPVWAQISAGETNLEIAIYSGRVEFSGEPEALDAVMNCFEMV